MQIPIDYIRRASSTIPFGYKESAEFDGYLEPIHEELNVLQEVSEAVFHGEISLGIGVDWLEAETGKKDVKTRIKEVCR